MKNNPSLRVLHVDDDLSFLEISKEIIEADGEFDVETATSVDEAFLKLATGVFDVVVSDYEMPEKNGLDFLEELKEKKADVPFILFTGKGREEVAIKALNLGAHYYLNKHGATETVYGELAHAIVNSTKSAKAEKALRESEAKYRELINGMSDTVWVIDFEGGFVDVNNAALRVLGYSREELLSLGVLGIDNHLSQEQIQNLTSQLPKVGTQVFETIHITKDGKEIPVEISSSLVIYQGKQAILSIARNITERKKAEEALLASEKRYRELYEKSPLGYQSLDAEGRFIDVNQAWLDTLGYSREEVIGHWFGDFLVPEQAELFRERFPR
ncbi:MAG: PAS domain S-box protein, partial [Candidatus Bathyarchaeia archaeon]